MTCLLKDEKDGEVIAKCGRHEKRKGRRLSEIDMTGWSQDVTCEACKAGARG